MRHAYAKMKWLGRRKPGVRAHIIDPVMPPQPVSDTPRTDEISNANGTSWMNGNLCRQLERELNAANEHIKRLEKAGEDLAVCGYFMGFEDELKAWRKAVKDSQ